jgi:hypothetical protein
MGPLLPASSSKNISSEVALAQIWVHGELSHNNTDFCQLVSFLTSI